MKVLCDHCGKFLFETDKKYKGEIVSEAMDKKYFITYVNGFKIFCCLECAKTWSDKNVTPEKSKDIMCSLTDNTGWIKSKLGVK